MSLASTLAAAFSVLSILLYQQMLGIISLRKKKKFLFGFRYYDEMRLKIDKGITWLTLTFASRARILENISDKRRVALILSLQMEKSENFTA